MKIIEGSLLYDAHSTEGMPTDIMSSKVYDRGACINWASYVIAAKRGKWTFDKTMNIIYKAILEQSQDILLTRKVVLILAYYWNEVE